MRTKLKQMENTAWFRCCRLFQCTSNETRCRRTDPAFVLSVSNNESRVARVLCGWG